MSFTARRVPMTCGKPMIGKAEATWTASSTSLVPAVTAVSQAARTVTAQLVRP